MANSVYANGRAKSLENGLLGLDRLNRMIDSSSADEALKILAEVGFGDGASAISPLDFEVLTDGEQKKLFKFILDTCPDQDFKKFLLLKNDFHNAEAFIKAKHLKIDADAMLVEDGIYEKDLLKERIMLDEYRDFPDEMAKALMTADAEFVGLRATGASIDLLFKKALYAELKNASKHNKYLKEIYSAKADCANAAVALRSRNYAEAKEFFVVGGSLSATDLKALCEDAPEVLKDKCKYFNHNEMISAAVEGLVKGEPLSAFEKLADSYAVTYLKKEKYSLEGIHPFMLYCYYKLAEIENVRIIMVCLNNGVEKAEIKARIRDTYEG